MEVEAHINQVVTEQQKERQRSSRSARKITGPMKHIDWTNGHNEGHNEKVHVSMQNTTELRDRMK
eukprot:scaffold454995_cov19-Prasinocladus_malaysianus.AAC.1